MSEQTYPEGWALAWHRLPSSPPMRCWQHQNGRLSGVPDSYVDWREEGWYADPRMEPQPDKPEPPIENGWWLVRRRDWGDAVFVRERRGDAWWWLDGSLAMFECDPVCRLTDEQAALLREQTGGEQ